MSALPASERYERRLKALRYYSTNTFSINTTSEVSKLVNWLETKKIRFYTIEEREKLRVEDPDAFKIAFSNYLTKMECPYAIKDIHQIINWLLNKAIRSEYSDTLKEYPELKCTDCRGARAAKVSTSTFTLPISDIQGEEFKMSTNKFCDLLKIPNHSDHLLRLESAVILIQELVHEKSEQKSAKEYSDISTTPKDLGFNLGKESLDQAAMALRLLHLDELRKLQTNINEVIVKVQNVTANPKTNQNLGRVGRH